MFLIIAAALLFCFVANVALGSILAAAPLGDVAEAVLLFCASIAFVAGVLKLEANAAARSNNQDNA